MGILYFIGAIVLLAFASRNLSMALASRTTSNKVESWVSAAVCLAVAMGLFFAGCSHNRAAESDPGDSYESNSGGSYNSGNQNSGSVSHPWDSPMENYKQKLENKKPWE
jgi:hypothetical protein